MSRERESEKKRGYKTSEPNKKVQPQSRKIAYLPSKNAFRSNQIRMKMEKSGTMGFQKKNVFNNELY